MILLHKVFVPDNLDTMMSELRAVIASGWVGEGPKVQAFEQELKPIVGSDNVTALNACTSSLQLALRLAGVGPGDEVVTTPMTCMATNLPIVLGGARRCGPTSIPRPATSRRPASRLKSRPAPRRS